jgi:hypothetical protein
MQKNLLALRSRARPVSKEWNGGSHAISLSHDFVLAHFQLGAVLSRLGWYHRALQAFENCLTIRPDFVAAHKYVARISELRRLIVSHAKCRQEFH